MPKQFSGSVDTPTNLRFGANEFVDESNPLEQLPGAADALAKATSGLVLRSFADQQNEEIAKQDELYSKAREAKQGMYDSAIAGDAAAVDEYASKLSDLKVAERQGAISGTNSQIRQETLLKTYINRYPHLEETIRQQYSSTRARAQAEREQFKDPIEKGMDALLERSYAAGRNPARQIEYEQGKADLEMKKEMLSYRSMLGISIQGDMDIIFENQGRFGAIMDVQDYISNIVNQAEMSGREINADEAKAGLRIRAELYKKDWRVYLSDVLSKSNTPGAVLSKEYVDAKMTEIDKIFDDQASMIDSHDTLKALDRASKVTQFKTLNEIAKINPLIGFMVRAAPEKSIEMLVNKFDRTKMIYLNGGMSAIRLEQQKSLNVDAEVMDFHLQLMGAYENDGKAQARDFEVVMQKGEALAPSGSTKLDAARIGMMTATVLEDDQFDEEEKANALRSATQSEKQLSRPGEYLAPSRTFYTDPARAKELRENPRAIQEMTQTLDQDAPYIVDKLFEFNEKNKDARPNVTFSIYKEDTSKRNPWESYPSGGPWSSNMVHNMTAKNNQFGSPEIMRRAGLAVGSIDSVVAALNNDYWIYRNMHGAAAAEAHAKDIMVLINKRIQEKAEAEAENQTVDLDTTD